MAVAKIDGTSIAYEVTGDGPPLVFLHCWTGSKRFYFNQVEKFSRDYTCVCVDFPGHGESGELEGTDYSVERFGEMTRTLLARLGIKRAVFVGHSLGGMVCFYLGIHYPDSVAGLVLLDTTSHLSGFFFQRLGALAAVALGAVGAALWNTGFKLTKAVVAGTAATHPLAGPDPRLLSARECSRGSNKAMTLTLNKARNFNATPRLGEISAPALIVVGNADLLADVRHANRMATGLPNSTLLVVRGAGHMTLFEKPEIVNDAMADFLARTWPPAKAAKKAAKKAARKPAKKTAKKPAKKAVKKSAKKPEASAALK
ncbi:MAG TPA: alpha/beta hydrolase [Candidatus Anoxymicrobiaceae bacterium]|jgi:3-oxoadipate enol-lactonase